MGRAWRVRGSSPPCNTGQGGSRHVAHKAVYLHGSTVRMTAPQCHRHESASETTGATATLGGPRVVPLYALAKPATVSTAYTLTHKVTPRTIDNHH